MPSRQDAIPPGAVFTAPSADKGMKQLDPSYMTGRMKNKTNTVENILEG